MLSNDRLLELEYALTEAIHCADDDKCDKDLLRDELEAVQELISIRLAQNIHAKIENLPIY